ncbi:hypothetical protein [Butyrivibrio sp. AE3006]|uniref:hypothetical protein n=1 Tax=Butyrivibrio sp. AE3006 TaxID=1280673 RepID=UPI0004793D34|nr:hypothetical protein [Butyrivibrio sp. AE3006]
MTRIVKLLFLFIIGAVCGIAVDELSLGRMKTKSIDKAVDMNRKFYEFYKILLRWLKVHQDGRSVTSYLKKHGYKRIAIYGMKELGVALLDELKDSEIEVAYTIDRDADNIYVAADVYKPDEKLEPVDAVVVTAVHFYYEIKNDMSKKLDCPILSLEEIVWEA